MKMIFRPLAIVLPWVIATPAMAQYEGEIEIPDHVLEAIREFSERAPGESNEVVVVLDPPEAESGVDAEPDAQATQEEDGEIDDVVASILREEAEEEVDTVVEITPGEPSPQGPEVRVQPLRDPGQKSILPSDVSIRTPFAAKPLGSPSPGWKLTSSPLAPAFTQNVEVAPGTWLTLSIRPHVLVPDADGHAAFQIQEPGFDPALGYRQASTVSASLASSIRQLEEDSRILGQVIDDLEQILISLPKSDSE